MRRDRILRSVVPAALLLAAAGRAAHAADLAQILSYDTDAPLGLEVVGTQQRPGVTVQDVTFRSAAGGAPVSAYVVRPSEGAGPFAGVLFVHWFAPETATSNRTQFLGEAEALARRGTVSLLVSTFWSDPARYRARRWETDYQNTVDQAKDLRRALDVLLAQPGVDPRRVGYVGHDYGAMFGALVAAADARPKAYVMIAGTARFTDWYLFGSASGVPAGAALDAFKARFAPLEPVHAIAQARAAVFYQFGERDRYTPREDFIALYLATPGSKRISTYDSDHPMEAEIIRHDRTVWLAAQLALPVAP